jgi:hypothetical protein
MIRTLRVILLVAGVAAAGYGTGLLLEYPSADLVAVLGWLVGGVLAHDAVIAPLVIAASFLGTRLLPEWARGPMAAGLVILGTVTLTAVPVLLSRGARPDNSTLLDRNYGVGWLVLAAVVAVGVTLTMVVRRVGASAGTHAPSEERGGEDRWAG